MRAIVTGGAGFIGSHMVDLLIEKKNEVIIVDNLSTGSIDNLNPQAIFENISITEEKKMTKIIKEFSPDYIFHFAALPRIQPSFDDPISHDDVNVRGSLKLISAIHNSGVNIKALINSSSSSIYGNPQEIPTSENAQIQPLSPYALQKYTSERYLHIFSKKFKIPIVSLRYFNPYGPRAFNIKNPYNAYTSVIGIFKNRKDNKKKLLITGDGTQKRDFIHVKDVAEANYLVAKKIDITNGKVYNVGSGITTSILEVAKLFGVEYSFIPKRDGEAEITHANINALLDLGWTLKYDLKESIEKGNI